MKTLIGLTVLLLPGMAYAARNQDPTERAVVAAGMVILLAILGVGYGFLTTRSKPGDKIESKQGSKKTYLILIVAAIIVILAVFVWPTQYKYEQMGGTYKHVVRIDRFTGEAEMLYANEGWKKMGPRYLYEE